MTRPKIENSATCSIVTVKKKSRANTVRTHNVLVRDSPAATDTSNYLCFLDFLFLDILCDRHTVAQRRHDWPTASQRRVKSNTVTTLIGAGLRVGGAFAPVSPRLRKTPFWSDSGNLTEKSRSRFSKGNRPDLTRRSATRIVVLF